MTPDAVTRANAVTAVRLAFGAAAVLAMVLGYAGLERYLRTRNGYGDSPLDLLYYDLQLFVLGSPPLDAGGPYPLPLQIARFLAPAVTVYAIVEAGRLLLAGELRRLRTHRSRGHAVVCGDGLLANALGARLSAGGRKVVMIREGAAAPLQSGPNGVLQVFGNPRQPSVLRGAGGARAGALYVCTADDAANTAVALAAHRLARGSLAAHVRIGDPELCAALRARRLGVPRQSDFRLDFFNLEELAARELLAGERLEAAGTEPAPVMIVGFTAFGRAVLVEIARHWRLSAPARPLPVQIVDPAASARLAALSRRYPFLGETCRPTLHPELPGAGARPPQRVYICHDDEEAALKTALTAVRLWQGGPGSVVVRLERMAAFGGAFHGPGEDRLLDDAGGVLRLFGIVDAACAPALIGEDLTEQFARVIHERYLIDRLRRGESLGTTPSLVPWRSLPETLKRANRAAAADIGRKLGALGCALVPRVEPWPEFAFRAGEVERLAEMEHQRWTAERRAEGWRHGAGPDEAARRHPDLVPWDRLPEESRQKDRDAVLGLPGILADAGFQIVRLGERR